MRQKRRQKRPLDESALRDLALSYVARFATTAAKLENYLLRKIRERGLADGSGDIDVRAIVDRLVELKYIDDEAYAKARAGSLLRRGYGEKRISEALRHAGVDEYTREDVAPDTAKAREAALTMARKRRFGPFGLAPSDELNGAGNDLESAVREKQIAAMIRSGHGFDAARFVINARSVEQVEQWLDEAIEEAESEGRLNDERSWS